MLKRIGFWMPMVGLAVLVAGCGGGGGDGGGHAVVGYVVDADTSQPVGGALVVIGGFQTQTRTIDGGFRLDGVPVGPATISVTKTGYQAYAASITVNDVLVTSLSPIQLTPTGGGGGGGGDEPPGPPPGW